MANIFIKITNQQYVDTTSGGQNINGLSIGKGSEGLGKPYVSTNNSEYISVTEDILKRKLELLKALFTEFQSYNSTNYNNFAISGTPTRASGGGSTPLPLSGESITKYYLPKDESVKAMVADYFILRLRDILYEGEEPPAVLKDKTTFRTYWPNYDHKTITDRSASGTKNYLLSKLLSWVNLFDDTIKLKAGLSSTNEPPEEEYTPTGTTTGPIGTAEETTLDPYFQRRGSVSGSFTRFLAEEGQFFGVNATASVAYGTRLHYTTKIFSSGSGYACNNETFSDPAPGISKACYVFTADPQKFLGYENSTFTLTQRKLVKYGITHAFEENVINKILDPGTYSCSNAAFGSDPRPGLIKACYQFPPDEILATEPVSSIQARLINALTISGSDFQIVYERYATTDIPSASLIISNSSADFGIQLYHSSSANSNVYIMSGSTIVNKDYPVLLPPASGSTPSTVKLTIDANTLGLNTLPVTTAEIIEPVFFDAIIYPIDDEIYYDVNTFHPDWGDATNNTQPNGLGSGYIRDIANIKFEERVLKQKRTNLQKVLNYFQAGNLDVDYKADYFGGSSGATNNDRFTGFSILVYTALHAEQIWRNKDTFRFDVLDRWAEDYLAGDTGKTSSEAGTGWDWWGIPKNAPAYIQTWIGSTGVTAADAGQIKGNSKPVQKVREYIQLINDILDEKNGLSKKLPRPLENEPLESSKVKLRVGQADINFSNAQYNISNAIVSASKALIDLKTIQFFDENREYKTILNFGQDKQYLVESWRTVPSDSSSIQLKLLSPLVGNVQLYDSAYIAQEFAKSVVDTLTIDLPPILEVIPYLRPANTEVGKFSINHQNIKNVTLTTLNLDTGSVGVISSTQNIVSYEDRVFNRWYTSDYNSSELNIDFSDYNNFVFFGSAKSRLESFANKLAKIQSYPVNISVSSSNDSERKLAIERELIKRNFDQYEQYLYFASQSEAYSGSAYYIDGGIEYNSTGSWPKDSNMIPLTFNSSSVQLWYTSQSAIAERFDLFNPNYLIKHLPEHIQEDTNSSDFIKFIQMFGHVMDNIKVYIDQFPNIYATSPDPFTDLSMDQVYEVAKSFGLNLPNAYSLESLQSFVSSLYDGPGARSFVAETWKRFIHSANYIQKLKGTRTGADVVLNTYGLNSPLLQVKESSYAIDGNYIKSDETTYALLFTGSISSSIRLPFVSSSYTPSTLQVRFNPELKQKSSLLTTNGTWGIDLVPHPSSSEIRQFSTQSITGVPSYFTILPANKTYGRIEVISGSSRTVIASSSYFPLFSDTYTHIMLRSQSQDITVIQTDGDQILYQYSASVALDNSLWNSTYVYIGGTGSLRYGNFDGILDDVRIWGEETTTDNFIKQAYDPGTYFGNTYSSSYNSLYVDLSFSQPYASITQSATNESPFYEVTNLTNIPTTGLTTASYVRILRGIKQFTPVVGSSIFSNNKVTVAPEPAFYGQFIDDSGAKLLKLSSSIKSVEEKKYTGGEDYVQFAISPVDFINQTIVRSMGDVDTNYLIGSPKKYTDDTYTELNKVFDFFLKNYNETINPNKYIRFFRNVVKAPVEYMEGYTPARATLVKGVVIESPMLHRIKTRVQKSFKVDGSNTRTFEKFVAGSGSYTASINRDAGAYDFVANYTSSVIRDYSEITNPTPVVQKIRNSFITSSIASRNSNVPMIDGEIETVLEIGPVSSTEPAKLPENKQFTQVVGNKVVSSSLADRNSSVPIVDALIEVSEVVEVTDSTPPSKLPTFRQVTQLIGNSYASSSILDNKSSIGFVDAEISTEQTTILSQSGYARKIYLGLRYNPTSSIYRVQSETNTITPFYAISPVSDFSDVGTTTYFYNNTGLYYFNSVVDPSKKQYYRAKLDVPIGEISSIILKELANITLLEPTRLTDVPGRYSITMPRRVYSTSPYKGVLNTANIISLYRISAAAGLRLRLYRTQEEQNADITRSFVTVPASNAGVLFDGILQGDNEVFPYTLIKTDNSILYFTVDNTTVNDIESTITLTYFEYEPANIIPQGYLSRHYKFTRTNNTASRRKSYLGSKLVFCPEGCPPDVIDPNNRTGKVSPRRLENGSITMPQLLLESTTPVVIYDSPTTNPTVNKGGRRSKPGKGGFLE